MPCRLAKNLIVHIAHHVVDYFSDVLVELCGGLEVLHLVLAGKLLSFLLADLPLVLEVDLVADQALNDLGVRMLVDAVKPRLHVRETLPTSHVKGHYHTIGLLVEGVGDGAEALLPCGVPDLNCDVIPLWRLISRRHVVKPDRRHVRLCECLILVPVSSV